MPALEEAENGLKYTYKIMPGQFIIVVSESGKATAAKVSRDELVALTAVLDVMRHGSAPSAEPKPSAPSAVSGPVKASTPPKSKPRTAKPPKAMTAADWQAVVEMRESFPPASWAEVAEAVGVNKSSLAKHVASKKAKGISLAEILREKRAGEAESER